MDVKKSIGKLALAAGFGGVLAASAFAPAAYGAPVGWSVDEMLQSSNVGDYIGDPTNINQSTISQKVSEIITWLFGIAVVLVVLRIALTAINRLVFKNPEGSRSGGMGGGMGGGREGAEDSLLQKIPLVGAYPNHVPWKNVFGEAAKNIAIVAGVWVIMQVIVGFIQFAFTALQVTGKA